MNDSLEIILRLLATAFLIAINALFVFHEFAFVTLKPRQIREMDKDTSRLGRLISKAAHRIDHYIAVDQLGITASSIAVGWIGQPAVTRLFTAVFGELGLPTAVMTVVSSVLAFALLTGTQMVVGELMPKSYALRHPERTARFTARPVELTAKLLHPFVVLLNGIGLAAVRLLGFRGTGELHYPVLPAEELVTMIQSSAKAGLLQADPKVLSRLVNFSDLRATDLMTPRPDIIAVNAEATFDEVLQTARLHLHDRYPVYQASLDQMIGVINVKDLLSSSAGEAQQRLRWQRHVQSIPILPETASVEMLLVTLNRTKNQMALLVDEFGAIAGIVTTTDITEQLISGPDEIQIEPSGSFLIQAHATLAVVDAELGIALNGSEHNVDTIAGLVLDELGRIPQPGDTVRVNGHLLTVVAMDGHRIITVRLQLEPDDVGHSN